MLDPIAYADSFLGSSEVVFVKREAVVAMIQDVAIMSRADEALACVKIAQECGAAVVSLKLLERAKQYNETARAELQARGRRV